MEIFAGSRIRDGRPDPLAFGKERLFRSDEGMFTQKVPSHRGLHLPSSKIVGETITNPPRTCESKFVARMPILPPTAFSAP